MGEAGGWPLRLGEIEGAAEHFHRLNPTGAARALIGVAGERRLERRALRGAAIEPFLVACLEMGAIGGHGAVPLFESIIPRRASVSASWARARWIQVLTVPTGRPTDLAISSYGMACSWKRVKTNR